MKKLIISIFCFSFLMFIPFETGEGVSKSQSRYAADHIIIKLKKDINNIAASIPGKTLSDDNIIKEIGYLLDIEIKSVKKLFPRSENGMMYLYDKYELGTYYLAFFNEKNDAGHVADNFNSHTYVDFAEPDFIGEAGGKKDYTTLPNDKFFYRQWGLKNDGNYRTTTGRPGKVGADMNVIKGWDVAAGSGDVIVAILDSGVKLDHPEISGRLWINREEVKNGIDDDKNGYTDDINGYNFAYDNPNLMDDGGHGTNIAGTIGASSNNEIGYSGIDQKCRIMICKNLDEENLGEYSWWSESLYYAANNGANVINMSEGGYDYSKTLHNAVKFADEAGCLIVASMMNKNNSDSYYPASFKEVMAVGATDTDDSRCKEFTWGGGSNWGKHIAVVAPGNRIYGLDFKSSSNYDVYWSGTSQATAFVSGIAAILLGQDKSRSNSDLKEIIKKTATDMIGDPREDTPGWDEYYGNGRVDLFAALTFGNLPSGNKDGKKKNQDDNKVKDQNEINPENENDKKAKAEDDNYIKNENRDDMRAKKYDPRDR